MSLLSSLFKASGYYGRAKAVSYMVSGSILIILGLVLGLISGSFNALILSAFGLFALVFGWILWKRCKSLTQGKFM